MLPMHCGHSPPAERPGATSRRALSTGQRQETPYVPSPAFVRARSATDPARGYIEALTQRGRASESRAVPRFFGLPQAPQAHNTLPIER